MSPEAPGFYGDKIVRKRWKWFAAGGGFLLCIGLGWFALWAWSSEPQYKGKNLEYWFRNRRQPEAILALSTIVKNNPENVVSMLGHDPPRTNRSRPLPMKLPQWVWTNHTLGPVVWKLATDKRAQRRALARGTFLWIGTNGVVAVPQLKRLLMSSTSQAVMFDAADILARLGPAGKEALFNVATNMGGVRP